MKFPFLLKPAIAIALMSPLAMLSSCHKEETGPDAGTVLYTQLSSVDKLMLSSMTINKIGEYDDKSDWKIGKRIAVYSYNTYMDAFIDLSKLTADDVSVDTRTKVVSLVLPPVQTEIRGRDVTMNEEHYRVTGLRSRIGSKERATLKEEMNTRLKAEIQKNPQFSNALRRSGEEKAREFFRSMLAAKGYTADITFKN